MPPSPASVCSTAQDEYCRTADCLSPMSTPNATPREDRLVPQAFRDISDNLSGMIVSLYTFMCSDMTNLVVGLSVIHAC